ncbi:N-acetyltransferase [Nocardioides sp. zg-DK7169]|uniref:GNAT family N-acetyltransferase n=1 Tax=Nocardioides sp. zg-DK7169 TaxID=2736600 RepID=UPI0015539395|nr:GNAT family N-acetyltransferase [Nocardioides sp. zg-DK7169]
MIRVATLADLDAVADLEVDNLGVDAWSPGLVEQAITDEHASLHVWVAEDDDTGEVVGHAVAAVVDVTELQRISVAGTHRRTGLASALLAEVVRTAERAGVERVVLEVREDNAGALAFYRAHGFVELARRRGYYRDGTTAIVLARDLTGTMAS